MNREKTAWMVSVGLLALLAFQLPGTLAQRDDDYAFVRTLVDIHRQVVANYVEPVDENKLREGAIDGLLSQLDPFSVYVPPSKEEEFNRMLEGSFKGVGIQLNQLDNGKVEVVTPIENSPAFKAGVMAGDIILKVNGESIEGLRLPEVIKKIGGTLHTEVSLTVLHATGEEATLTMTREEIIVPTVKGYQRKHNGDWDFFVCDDPKIGYVRITQFTPETAEKVQGLVTAMQKEGARGLILDLRFNPGGQLQEAVELVNLFVDHGTIVVTKGRNRPEEVKTASSDKTLPYMPMIVLVNEHSASASEIVAGSLMDNRRALVLGTRSYGKGSVQELINLDGKEGELKLTVAYYYLPSGRLVHRKKDATDWGVQPQIVVAMDAATERKVFQEIAEREMYKRPKPKVTTAPAAPTTTPASQPAPMSDTQLQRAVDTMIALVILQGERGGTAVPVEVPATRPAATTLPATTPATGPATPAVEP